MASSKILRVDERVDRLKIKIGYQKALDSVDLRQGVAMQWPDLLDIIRRVDTDPWEKSSESISFPFAGLIKWHLIFEIKEATLSIDVYVTSDESDKSFDMLNIIAGSTTTPEIPYERGLASLGQISIKNDNPEVQHLLWAFYNISVAISVEERDEDAKTPSIGAIALAHEIQKLLDKHVVKRIADNVPKIDRIDVSPQPVHVKEPVTLDVKPSKGTDPDNLLIKVLRTYDDYSLVRKDKLVTSIAMKEPGTRYVAVGIADKKTLLSVSPKVAIEVLSPSKP